MINKSLLRCLQIGITTAGILFLLSSSAEAKTGRSQAADIVFGGQGTGPGEFTILRDITFDSKGNLYTLEAGGPIRAGRSTEYTGVARVQKFDGKGNFISEFPLGDDLPADKASQPSRIAADSKGEVFVAFPNLNFVRQYGPDGKKIRDHELPGATAVAVDVVGGKEKIAAIAGSKLIVPRKGWQMVGGDEILLLDPDGGQPQHIALPEQLGQVQDITADKNGHFYVLAQEKDAIYHYDPSGKLVKIIGAQVTKATRNPDGSEPLWTVAVDSKCNIYSVTYGNPGLLTMYTADGKLVRQRGGQFKFADVWFGGGYAPLAISPDDRMWIASVTYMDPSGPNYATYHFRPAVLRTVANFFDPKIRLVKSHSTLTLGLAAKLESKLPFHVTHELAPIDSEFVVPAGNLNITDLTVTYHVYDYYKNTIAKGDFSVPLKNGEEARIPITFTPDKYGWYIVEARMKGNGEELGGVSEQFGVTPEFKDMPVKIEEFERGWNDVPRQMFCGLTNIRLAGGIGIPKSMEGLEKVVAECEKYGATWSIQITDRKAEFTPEKIRPLIEKFKGRVPRYELFNEPNFVMKPAEYIALAGPVYKMIKEVDPNAKVMGPSVCGIQLGWYKAFYEAGGSKVCDIITVHDYEGHESISPDHWRWKYGQLRKLMAQYGDGNKELWQTERCVQGLLPIGANEDAQAVRTSLHRDLLQTLGIPPEHNNHYYLNEGGYVSVPSYIWSASGPHPAALALRTREALTKTRHYTGAIDFGHSGNDMFIGLRYEGDEGGVVIVHNFGTLPTPMEVSVTGGDAIETSDAFGNKATVPVKDGKASLTIDQLPMYLLLKPGENVDFPKFEFGRNIAGSAKIAYGGKTDSDVALLQNGILESTHAGNPHGDTSGSFIWKGETLKPGAPQNLDLTWSAPHTIDTVFLYGVHADNPFCALLDYDVQVWQNGAWKTVSEVRTQVPPTDPVAVLNGKAVTWMQDNNFWVNRFDPVTTDRLRIVFLRATYGLAPDEIALDGRAIPSVPMLREIEVFSPRGDVKVAASVEQPDKTAAFDKDTVTVQVTNDGKENIQGVLRAHAPEGWSVIPSQAPVTVPAGSNNTRLTFTIKPPADIPVGRTAIDFSLEDAKGQVKDSDSLLLNIGAKIVVVPQPPGAFNKREDVQALTAMIRNQSTDPISGKITVQVSGPKHLPPVDADYGPVEPGGVFFAKFLVPGLHIEDGRWTAAYSTKISGMTVTSSQDLSVHSWSVVAPFKTDNDMEVAGPETDIAQNRVDISKDYTDAFGGEQKWKVIQDDAKGRIDLFHSFNTEEPATAYAAAWINSPKAQKALLSAAFNRGGRIWLNGKEVISHTGSSAFGWGQEQAPVDLKAGNNLVLVKVVKDNGNAWAFLFDLLDPASHQQLDNLRYSPKP